MNAKNIAWGVIFVIVVAIMIFIWYAFSLEPDAKVRFMGEMYRAEELKMSAVFAGFYLAAMVGLGVGAWVTAPLSWDSNNNSDG